MLLLRFWEGYITDEIAGMLPMLATLAFFPRSAYAVFNTNRAN